MQHRYAFLPFLLLSSGVFAQTITAGQCDPQPGDDVDMLQGAYMAPGAAGLNQTWDLNGFVSTGTIPQTFITPGSTPYGASFPSSNVAQDAGGGSYGYGLTNSSGYLNLGVQGDLFSLVCSQPMVVVPYPLTYNTPDVNPFSCAGLSAGSAYTRTGSITVTLDGTGTLILPSGTWTNVMRVTMLQSFTDAGDLINTSGTQTNVFWYKPGIRFALAASYATQYNGTPSNYTWLLDADNIGLDETQRMAIGVEAFPNPTDDVVTLTYGAGGRIRVEVLDGLGRLVLTEVPGAMPPGINCHMLELGGLSAGLYTVRVTSDTDGTGTVRVQVK